VTPSKSRAEINWDSYDIDPPFNSNLNYEVFWGATEAYHLPLPGRESASFDFSLEAAFFDTVEPALHAN